MLILAPIAAMLIQLWFRARANLKRTPRAPASLTILTRWPAPCKSWTLIPTRAHGGFTFHGTSVHHSAVDGN